MKAIKLVFVAALTAVVLMLTSCMGDSDNSGQGGGYGIVKFDSTTGRPLLHGVYYYPFYASNLQLCTEGDYIAVQYAFNLDDEANANYTQNGYIVAKLDIVATESEDMRRVRVETPSIVDIETPQTNEVKPGGIDLLNYLDNKLLTIMGINQYNKEDGLNYKIECDLNQEPESNNSLKIYDFYIRTMHEKKSTSSGNSYGEYVVFDLNSAIYNLKSTEANAGRKSFYVRINYVTAIGEDKITWGKSQLLEVASSNN